MPPIEIGPGGPQAARAVGAVDARIRQAQDSAGTPGAASASAHRAAENAPAAPKVERSAALDAGQPPIDTDRVAVIRKAIETGSYPVIPTRVADAMIAAGLLLRSEK